MESRIEKYVKGEELDIDKIVDDFSPYVNTIIRNTVYNNLSNEDKEEILLDTFFVVWKRNEEGYKIENLSAYISGITRNLIKEKLNKRKLSLDLEQIENSLDFSYYESYLEEIEKIEEVCNKIKNIKPDELKIFNMFYYSNISIKDIAKELRLSESNIKTKLHRTRKKIRKYLKEEVL